jgi:hypothetical protein
VIVGAWAWVSRGEGSGGREEDAPVLKRKRSALVKVMMGGKIGTKRR